MNKLSDYNISFTEPSGRERNPCPLCDKPFKVGEDVMSVLKSVYKGHTSFGLIHSRCFFKLMMSEYNFNLDEIKKEIVIDKLK